MPTKSLPRNLIERLRKAFIAGKITDAKLGKMPIVDHRQDHFTSSPKTSVTGLGRRIRQMNVSRTFPDNEFVIKRVHGETVEPAAKANIKEIKGIVKKHNQKESFTRNARYVLREPKAYAIGARYVAMAKADYPSIQEVMDSSTARGRKFRKRFEDKGIFSLFERVATLVEDRSDVAWTNMLVTGYRGEKFIFYPLIDLY